MIAWDEVSDPLEALQRSLMGLIDGLSDEETTNTEQVENILGDLLASAHNFRKCRITSRRWCRNWTAIPFTGSSWIVNTTGFP
jgi:hypothetical protein